MPGPSKKKKIDAGYPAPPARATPPAQLRSRTPLGLRRALPCASPSCPAVSAARAVSPAARAVSPARAAHTACPATLGGALLRAGRRQLMLRPRHTTPPLPWLEAVGARRGRARAGSWNSRGSTWWGRRWGRGGGSPCTRPADPLNLEVAVRARLRAGGSTSASESSEGRLSKRAEQAVVGKKEGQGAV
ncbi:hypothetical protein PVAP13_4NG221898 [Panicum virgatum]|uniref:Uncharacterized protein n=1 Tax=Panicum virgatum TaxID=38727 RepID=A0A8T0TFU0_PANVG|nr:hypothetical protein PVAP13_4NG221898 [Panicum virgatum]